MHIRHTARWALFFAGTAGAIVTIPAASASASVISAAAGPYSQNFDSFPGTGTIAWTQGSTIPGWSLYSVTSATTDGGVATSVASVTTSAGGNTTGSIDNYGTSSSDTDRSLGSVASDTTPGAQAVGDAKASFYYVAEFVNDTGSDLASINVGYTGEEWRVANATAQTMTFQTNVGSSPDFSKAPGFGGWSSETANTALTFTSPINSGTAATLNGHAAADSQVFSSVNVPLSVTAGSDFFIRWRDTNDSGLDDSLAINNVNVGFVAAVPEPVVLVPMLVLIGLTRRRRV